MNIYRAILNIAQNPPQVTITPIVLQNTIGNVAWTREEQGIFHGTLSGAFPLAGTIGTLNISSDGVRYGLLQVDPSNDKIVLRVFSANGEQVDEESLHVEIRVYPQT